MKWDPKPIGRLIVTLTLMCCAVVFMFMYPKDALAAGIIVSLLILWDFMYYKDFAYLKISKNGATARLNENSRKSVLNKEDFHIELKQFELSRPRPYGIVTKGYQSPSRFNDFVNLINKAKASKYDLANDSIYQRVVGNYRLHIAHQLNATLKVLDYNGKFFGRLQTLLRIAIVSYPSNQNIIASIKEKLINANNGKKSEINDAFAKAINDLKKIEP